MIWTFFGKKKEWKIQINQTDWIYKTDCDIYVGKIWKRDQLAGDIDSNKFSQKKISVLAVGVEVTSTFDLNEWYDFWKYIFSTHQ